MDCNQEERCIYSFERISDNKKILAVFNFSNEEQRDYRFKINSNEDIGLMLDSNMNQYGGDGISDFRIIIRENREKNQSISSFINEKIVSIDMKPFSASYYMIK